MISIATSAENSVTATPGEATEVNVGHRDIHCAPFDALTVNELYGILRLRSEVFVVEQACAYLDPDARDTEPATLHMWIATNDIPCAAYLRVLDDGDARRIGRVVTDAEARGRGLAARLMQCALHETEGPWVLEAQSHLTAWYERFGFSAAGDKYIEDGIPHVPMRHR